MKKTLVLAAALAMVATVASAQQKQSENVEGYSLPYVPDNSQIDGAPQAAASMPAEEQQTIWFYPVFQFTTENENRNNLYVPIDFGDNVSLRGVGQIYAPSLLYQMYNGKPFSETSNFFFDGTGPNGITDQDYINQFKDAGAWIVDSMQFWMFHNPYNIPEFPGKYVAYKLSSAQTTTARTTGMYQLPRSGFTKVWEQEVTLEDLVNSTAEGQNGQKIVVPDTIRFVNEPEGSLFGNKGEALMFMYINDAAPVTYAVRAIADTNQREFQGIFAHWEMEVGAGGNVLNPVDTLNLNQTFATVMYKQNGQDIISSAWRNLFYSFAGPPQQTIPARFNLRTTWWGAVDISSSVKYHFGYDATTQGLGTVTPNPVTSNARLPFSLTELANVQIDLYDINGRMVKNLVSAQRWVPGNYSVALPVNELENGAYLVRMTANDKSYSMKFTVAR